ncbi:WD40-repeat-containing domain protein [Microdochium trichocladiopsis]|uniref:WD40-repeat-containing domain protein n=1 Tax=Microdochium trichocladiopsis TaxID=1682393 RepID=A0A9P8YB82_9PEZI|nr:WD40-repeat-containing domain protein [Microdochium trichocladiopsis]KAH7033007.1 WD40-repeat-containing domain protein [Microdochium trichocladiopsis]
MSPDADTPTASNGSTRPHANGNSQPRPDANGSHKVVSGSTNGFSHRRAPPKSYFGHDSEEVTRLLIQALSDMGYQSAADSVSRDSGFELESSAVTSFRNAVLEGEWAAAQQLLSGAAITGERSNEAGNGLVLAAGADRNMMRFWIRQQKYLEQLERRDTAKAVATLRTELTPLYQESGKLHFLSGLLMCQTADEVRTKAEWDGAYGKSRQVLLSELSKCISPSVMLPEHRLAILLHQVKASQVGSCVWHSNSSTSLYSDHRCERRNFPTENVAELDDHDGEVWQVVFSHDGTRLATCGSDKKVILWEVPSFRQLHVLGGHNDGVGNVAWSWDDSLIVTCCQDRYARLWDTNTGFCLKTSERFQEPVCSAVWAADNQSFITGSLDKTRSLVQWDLSMGKIFDWPSQRRVEDLAMSRDGRWLVAMDDTSHIQAFNLHTRELEYEMDLQVRLASVNISQDCRHLLVNHNNGVAQLIDLVQRETVQKYTGHGGGEYMIRNDFGGANESYVIGGSEDGCVFIWHKASEEAVEKLSGHTPRCNSVSWSPTDPCLFASCGDDGKVKIWSNSNFPKMRADLQNRQHETGNSFNGS